MWETHLAWWYVYVSDLPSSLLRACIRSSVSIKAVIHELFLSYPLMLRCIHSCVANTHAPYSFMRCIHSFISYHVSATLPHAIRPVFSSIVYHIHGPIPPCLYLLLTIYQVECSAPSQEDTSRC